MRILTAHKKPITCLAFSPDGSLLAEAAHGGTVRVWDVTTGEVAHTFDEKRGLFPNQVKLAFLGNNHRLAVANDRLAIHDLRTGTRTQQPGKQSSFHAISASANGKLVVSSGDEFQRWSGAKFEPVKSTIVWPKVAAEMRTYPGAAVDADGKRIAVCRKNWMRSSNQCDLIVLETKNEHVLATWTWVGHEAKKLAFHPGGALLAAASGPKLRVWKLDTAAEVVTLQVGKLHFQNAAFTPDGRYLAAVSKDRTVRFWDAAMFREAKTFDWDIGALLDLAFAPDGTTVAVASETGQIMLFDVD